MLLGTNVLQMVETRSKTIIRLMNLSIMQQIQL